MQTLACKQTSIIYLPGILTVLGFMPTDAVPELWYSPKGFDPLPPGLEERKRTSSYFHWEQLAPNWGACHWDQ